MGAFPLFVPGRLFSQDTAVATAANALIEAIFCESVDNEYILQISSTFQEADCLLKLVKVNKQSVPRTFIKQKSLTELLRSVSVTYKGK